MAYINPPTKQQYNVKNVYATSGTDTNYSFHHLFSWINETLSTNLSELKELSSGAAYCQILDVIFPGCIPLQKVHFVSNSDAEYTHNYKLLNEAFMALGIKHTIEMTRLVKGSRIEHLQFMQWLRKFFEVNYDGHSYNALEMRLGKDLKIGLSNQKSKKGYEDVEPRYHLERKLGK